MDNKEILKQLQAPFNVDEIEWRIVAKDKTKTKGLVAAYVSNRAIQNRFDEVCGVFGWHNEFKEWKVKEQICGISILNDNGEWVTKWDGASDSKTEATKGGLSSSMKRAAVQWGVGRYLYKLPQMWVKIKNTYGDNYVIDEIPKLPKWALPKFEKQNPDWNEETQEFEIPENIQKCINSFAPLDITQAELENYLHKEAFTFDEQDIQNLKLVYLQVKNKKKTKEDFFVVADKKTASKARELEKELEEKARKNDR